MQLNSCINTTTFLGHWHCHVKLPSAWLCSALETGLQACMRPCIGILGLHLVRGGEGNNVRIRVQVAHGAVLLDVVHAAGRHAADGQSAPVNAAACRACLSPAPVACARADVNISVESFDSHCDFPCATDQLAALTMQWARMHACKHAILCECCTRMPA